VRVDGRLAPRGQPRTDAGGRHGGRYTSGPLGPEHVARAAPSRRVAPACRPRQPTAALTGPGACAIFSRKAHRFGPPPASFKFHQGKKRTIGLVQPRIVWRRRATRILNTLGPAGTTEIRKLINPSLTPVCSSTLRSLCPRTSVPPQVPNQSAGHDLRSDGECFSHELRIL
jgi:hypothetical protein